MEALTEDQQSALTLFREVTADSHDVQHSIQVLKSCNWNIEQALQLHLASHDEVLPSSAPSRPTASAPPAGLGEPLLGGSSASTARAETPSESFYFPVVGWIARRIKQIGVSVFGVLYTFFFGSGFPLLGAGGSSGAAFARTLTNSYGSQLSLPQFFEGTFTQALSAARRDLKLLVVFLHSEHARYSQSFCTDVLSNEFVRHVLDESFILWGGDVARLEAHQVAQVIRARQFPCFCVLLPASIDEIRVIGALHGQIIPDACTALLAACLEEMESHRSEILAQQLQHAEDRTLREQQDREYQEALEMDRRRQEEQQLQERELREARRLAEEEQRKQQEEIAAREAKVRDIEERRRSKALSMKAEEPEAKSRIALRLPTGQRVERKFVSSTTLAEIYSWAECLSYLPEHEGKGLEIPHQFTLKTSFPSRELTEMDKTIEELSLAGTNILLSAVEDDEL